MMDEFYWETLHGFRNSELLELQQKLIAAKEAHKSNIRAVQAICLHPNVVECDYQPLFSGSLPPRRMCLYCGLEEDGWGSGYKKLKDIKTRKVIEVERDTLYQLRY